MHVSLMYVCIHVYVYIQKILFLVTFHVHQSITTAVLSQGRIVTAVLPVQIMTATTQFTLMQEYYVSSMTPISFVPTATVDHSPTGSLCNVANIVDMYI